MIINYNGIDLQIEHVTTFEQNAVYDNAGGGDYLYTHFRIGVQFVWNPFATSSNSAVDVASISVAKLRHALLTPRKKLTVTVGGNVTLQSPFTSLGGVLYVCDARNGPLPTKCDVLSFEGTKTMIGYFECETWLNECITGTPSVVLSHRWEMQSEIDEDYYTTRTISGEAVFRADLLFRQPGSPLTSIPDNYRLSLFHPIQSNFKRNRIVVTATPDGLKLKYTIVDEEQTLKIAQAFRSVTRIEGTVSGGYDYSDTLVFPARFADIEIKAWGTRLSTRVSLINACLRAATAYNFNNLFNVSMYYKASLTVDVIDKYAQLNAGVRISGASSTLDRIVGGLAPLNLNLSVNCPENLDGVAVIDAGTPTTPPPGDGSSRGTYFARVYAQALLGDCAAPVRGECYSDAAVALTYTYGNPCAGPAAPS